MLAEFIVFIDVAIIIHVTNEYGVSKKKPAQTGWPGGSNSMITK
jgi:hypothetical protein